MFKFWILANNSKVPPDRGGVDCRKRNWIECRKAEEVAVLQNNLHEGDNHMECRGGGC